MNKLVYVLPILMTLSACAGKTELVTQAYMPEPPEILMRKPKDLQTIKKEEKPDERRK